MSSEVDDDYRTLEKYILKVQEEICGVISDIADDLGKEETIFDTEDAAGEKTDKPGKTSPQVKPRAEVTRSVDGLGPKDGHRYCCMDSECCDDDEEDQEFPYGDRKGLSFSEQDGDAPVLPSVDRAEQIIGHALNERVKRSSQSSSNEESGIVKKEQTKLTNSGCQIPSSPIKIFKDIFTECAFEKQNGDCSKENSANSSQKETNSALVRNKNGSCVSGKQKSISGGNLQKQNGSCGQNRKLEGNSSNVGCQTSLSGSDMKDSGKLSRGIQTRDRLITIHKHGKVSRATQTHRRLKLAISDSVKPTGPVRSKSLQRNDEGDRKVRPRERKTSDSGLNDLTKDNSEIGFSHDGHCFLSDNSPEMQVVVNSLTPVISRRRTFKRCTSKGSPGQLPAVQFNNDAPKMDQNQNVQTCNPKFIQITAGEICPGTAPEETNEVYMRTDQSKWKRSLNLQPEESIIISPEMSRTWHGGSLFKPAPKMGLGMVNSESAPHFNMLNRRHLNTNVSEGLGDGHRSLPHISKSLLDAMHKKYCAYQYSTGRRPPGPRGTVNSTVQLLPLPVRLPMQNKLKPEESDTASSAPDSAHSSPRSQHKGMQGEITPDNTPTLQKKLNVGLKERRQAQIEAIEACKWLKAAGFPQYAQLYEDGQFPVDIAVVEKDHDFLDRDSIQSLFRRLHTLNRCVVMKIDSHPRKGHDDSDDEDICALSNRWEYQQTCHRWSRKDLELDQSRATVKSSSSRDSLLTDQDSSSPADESPVLDSKMPHIGYLFSERKTSTPADSSTSGFLVSPRLRRAASERIKSAKNLLKKMESFKTKRNKKFTNKNIVEISSPVVADREDMQAKIQHLNCVDISPTSVVCSPKISQDKSENSSGDSSPSPQQSPEPLTEKTLDSHTSETRKNLNDSTFSEYYTAHSQLLQSLDSAHSYLHSPVRRNNSDTNLMEIFFLPQDHKPGSFPKRLQNGYIDSGDGQGINFRTGSFSLGKESHYEDSLGHQQTWSPKRRGSHDPKLATNRISMYDNVGSAGAVVSAEEESAEDELTSAKHELDMILHELFENINGLNEAINGKSEDDSKDETSFMEIKTTTLPSPLDEDISIDHVVEAENDASSHMSSSQDASDQDILADELSPDDSLEHVEGRERRDSGVGSSLTRAPSDKKRKKIRWHSFQKSHRPSLNSRDLQIGNLSVRQLMVLRRLSLLKLTAIMEKYSPTNRTGWNWVVPRFMKRSKVPDYSAKNVFGVPLHVMLQRTGQPLPQCILYAMRYLRKAASDALGIFRKSGVRSRIQKLRNELEDHPEMVGFDELQAYDVADLLKQYFRELPECLLTNKLSETFISIFTQVPAGLRLEALQAVIVLLPDENRETLQSLLLFLSDISQHADEHQMTASNLAVCFAPSLFNMCGMRNNQTPSPKRHRKNLGVPEARELLEQKAAHECLTCMIAECKKIFMLPTWVFSKLHLSCVEGVEPVQLEDFYRQANEEGPNFKSFGEESMQTILKESHEKNRGWIPALSANGVDIMYKKPIDNNPLREWKCCVEVEAPPVEVLNRLLHERHVWDEDLLNWSVVEKLDKHADVFQYISNSMAPHPTRHYCVLRYWRTDLVKGACALVSTSVEHPEVQVVQGVRAIDLVSHYLIEPCGSGKSRVTHLTRTDTRGRSPEWYNKSYGYFCANYMEHIRDSFCQKTDLPETDV